MLRLISTPSLFRHCKKTLAFVIWVKCCAVKQIGWPVVVWALEMESLCPKLVTKCEEMANLPMYIKRKAPTVSNSLKVSKTDGNLMNVKPGGPLCSPSNSGLAPRILLMVSYFMPTVNKRDDGQSSRITVSRTTPVVLCRITRNIMTMQRS